MSKRYSARIHDPNHSLSNYDIYFNDDLINEDLYTINDIAEIFGTDTAQGSPAVINDAANLPPVSISANFPITKSGANLLKPNELSQQTSGGITFTPNSDGSITCDGTAVGDALYVISTNSIAIPFECKLSGCPSGGGQLTYEIRATYQTDPVRYYYEYGDGVSLPADANIYRVAIVIRSGQSVEGLTFKPMISPAGVSEYEQYKEEIYTNASDVVLYDGFNIIRSADDSDVTIEYIKKGV